MNTARLYILVVAQVWDIENILGWEKMRLCDPQQRSIAIGITINRLLVISYWLLVVGCWLLAMGQYGLLKMVIARNEAIAASIFHSDLPPGQS
ncbi:hypothetical protein [Microcoleus sp. CAWBG58]|uniref:hypothetical protein n=1 Tax=Microcoleus sp. CAWBG58 TaxID=2841651 RepID=UPI0025DDC21B|nr:hypothetical protein [Microcoleus sp. CAWBG58]